MKKSKFKRFFALLAVVLVVGALAIPAFALEDDDTGGGATSALPTGVSSALTTGMGSIQTGVNDALGIILPIVIGIVGTVLVVTIAMKLMKRFTGKA